MIFKWHLIIETIIINNNMHTYINSALLNSLFHFLYNLAIIKSDYKPLLFNSHLKRSAKPS